MNAETEHLFEHYGDILRARGLAPRSITIYQYSLKGFVGFLGDRRLSGATSADITSYQIQLGSERASDSRIHVATYALRSFLRFVLERDDWDDVRLPLRREPKRLPVACGSASTRGHHERATDTPKHQRTTKRRSDLTTRPPANAPGSPGR